MEVFLQDLGLLLSYWNRVHSLLSGLGKSDLTFLGVGWMYMVLKENTLYYFYFSLHWKILFLFNALGLQCIGLIVGLIYSVGLGCAKWYERFLGLKFCMGFGGRLCLVYSWLEFFQYANWWSGAKHAINVGFWGSTFGWVLGPAMPFRKQPFVWGVDCRVAKLVWRRMLCS